MLTADWRKRCNGNSGCVEARERGGMAEVRDSEDPDAPVLSFTPVQWARFLDSVKEERL